jgi:hypothetical protein
MKIHSIQDSSNTVIIKLLESGLSKVTESNLIKNYHPDYSNDLANIFYLLKMGDRYRVGNYFIIEEDNQYIGSTGWNWYRDDIVLALSRSYVIKKHRQRYILGNYILPKILDESIKYNRIWVTCNDYNRVIYDSFSRLSVGKSAGLNNSWPKIYSKFKPIGKKIVNYTDQYVAEYIREHNNEI